MVAAVTASSFAIVVDDLSRARVCRRLNRDPQDHTGICGPAVKALATI
jgi:hypothetical protein